MGQACPLSLALSLSPDRSPGGQSIELTNAGFKIARTLWTENRPKVSDRCDRDCPGVSPRGS